LGIVQKPEGTKTKSLWNRVAWFLLVGVVPLLFAVVLLGVILQLVFHVPVWSATTAMIGIGKPISAVSPLQAAQERTMHAEQQIQGLQSQNIRLQNELVAAQQKVQALKTQENASAVTGESPTYAAAKQEASVLATMDPGQAGQVLAKLSIEQSAQVVAAMDAATSGPILSAMDPKLAGEILTLAAVTPVPPTSSGTGSTTSNQTQ